ncbi:hypothetical protein ACWEO4_42515 [Streptomyces sp. NPDC004393]
MRLTNSLPALVPRCLFRVRGCPATDRGGMGFEGEVWRLMREEELLGEIVISEVEFPWLNGRFVPTPTFAEVKPWFDESLALREAEEYARFDDSYAQIAGTLSLVAPSGPVAEFLLHIGDGRAWFRWSDEPFDDV